MASSKSAAEPTNNKCGTNGARRGSAIMPTRTVPGERWAAPLIGGLLVVICVGGIGWSSLGAQAPKPAEPGKRDGPPAAKYRGANECIRCHTYPFRDKDDFV